MAGQAEVSFLAHGPGQPKFLPMDGQRKAQEVTTPDHLLLGHPLLNPDS